MDFCGLGKAISIFLSMLAIVFCIYDAEAGIYYVAMDGSDSNPGTEAKPWLTIQKAANTLVAGDMVYIKWGTYRERVVPINDGNPSAYISYVGYPGHSVVVDGSNITLPSWSGLIDIQGRSYIRVAGLRIMNAGPGMNNAGILIDNSHHIVIENNYIYNTVSSGIGVWGSDSIVVAGNEIQLCCNDGEQECISIGNTSNFEVRGNHVHHGGPGTNGGEGIDIKDGSHDGKVYGNNVHHMNRVGLYLDAWDKHTYNIDVFRNAVYDNEEDGIAVASEMGGVIENINIYNNISYHNGYIGLVLADWGGQVPAHPLNNIKVINNTFYNNGSSGWGGGISMDNQWATNVVLRNNILSQNASFTIVVAFNIPSLTVDYNLIDGFKNYENETKGINYQEGNPLFVNAALANFHLQINSPAIDNGSEVYAPDDDYDGVVRNQGLGYDIGAFEYSIIAPDIIGNPNPVKFGNVLVNNAVSKTIEIKNSGSANLLISNISNPASPFSIIDNDCSMTTLPPGATCSIVVQCFPTIANNYTSSLVIQSNAQNKSNYLVNLSAVAVNFMMSGSNIVLSNDQTGLWEPGETVIIVPFWTNNSTIDANSVSGTITTNDTGVALDNSAYYGTIHAGETVSCSNYGNCYGGTAIGPRPTTHWDVIIAETLSTTHIKDWLLHIGASFNDVYLSDIFYRYIEALLHYEVASGCDATHYCPLDNISRAQMAKFLCLSMQKNSTGSCSPSLCSGIFQDVPVGNIFCPYIEELYNRGITAGCQTSPLKYCPSNYTTRQAMSKYVCLGMEVSNPGSCITSACTNIFGDVDSDNPFCSYIEALYNTGIVAGCQASPLLYCPSNYVSRAQMAKYLVNSFGLIL